MATSPVPSPIPLPGRVPNEQLLAPAVATRVFGAEPRPDGYVVDWQLAATEESR